MKKQKTANEGGQVTIFSAAHYAYRLSLAVFNKLSRLSHSQHRNLKS